MLTKHRRSSCINSILPEQDCLLVPCACADWFRSGCRSHTPHSKQLALSVQWRRSHSARTLLPDYWQVWQRTDLASRFARGSVASTSACLAGLSKRVALSCRSFDNSSLAIAMARGFEATFLCAHGPTVLTNPEPCSADFLSACAFIATGCIQDAYSCPHVMTWTIWSSEKYFCCVISIYKILVVRRSVCYRRSAEVI